MNVKTRAGLVPVETEMPYSITTEEAEEFLQQKFDAIVSAMQKKGEHQEDVKIMLFTTKCSKKFMPFMVLLPLSVLKGKKERKNDYELDLFNPESSEKIAKLKDPFYQLIGSFIYNKNDESSFFSNAWRQALGVSLKTSHMLKANRTPKIQKFNKGASEYVVCMLDPVRLFHDMLTDVNNKDAKFGVEIAHTECIKSTNFRYEVLRVARKKKKTDKSFEDRLAYEINMRVNG